MKKLFILILLFSGILHATIDERKSDVYFANGINTTDSEADISLQFSLVPPLPRWNAYSNNKGNTWAEAAIKYMNRHTHTS